MSHWQQIRLAAQAERRKLFTDFDSANVQLNPKVILERLEESTKIKRCPLASQDPLLQNSLAFIKPEWSALFFNQDLPEWFALYCQAHEYAHFFLHKTSAHCAESDFNRVSTEDAPLGRNRVAGYSAHERREREANLFARELLLPSDLLRQLFIEKNWRAKDFKTATGLDIELIRQQLAHALLVFIPQSNNIPNAQSKIKENILESSEILLDDSQKTAARSKSKRLLIEAGPGTGKTRTLTARILYLLKQGVAAENILALTFSNQAAEEMRERIAACAPDAATKIWLGTFHSFGLELLRKYSAEAGIDRNFRLLDPIDAGLLLEKHLLDLELRHYQNLKQPTANLKNILNAISRAKDEMADAAAYEQAANEMLIKAQAAEKDDEKSLLAAEKALEIARVYRFYEQMSAEKGWLDLGDLVFRAARLLAADGSVKEQLQAQFTHILVDEFQDVNRAGGRLLKELTGANNYLWVVGDIRQTIYRWRGASAANLRLFLADFPDAETVSLDCNYRSQPPVVKLLNEFAPHVESESNNSSGWTAVRDETSQKSIYNFVADSFTDETRFLAQQILQRKNDGLAFRDQIVLGRTNKILSDVAAELVKYEIPVLYLGNLFERDEIRDLLCLLALSSPNSGRHLLRLCQLSEYNFDPADVRRLMTAAEQTAVAFPMALKLAASDPQLTDETKAKFASLEQFLSDVNDNASEQEATAWQFFAAYLFDASDYLLPIIKDEAVAAQQKRFALYQFLQFALAEHAKKDAVHLADANPRQAFSRFVRHLSANHEESVFRRLPVWAEEIDAVKLLTVHQAKGLEFPVVYLPHLGNRHYPNSWRGEPCPLPAGLTGEVRDVRAEHEEEEKCLFFVALSRARNELILSCAKKYGEASSKSSRFLALLDKVLPPAADIESADQILDAENSFSEESPNQNHLYSFYGLAKYIRCPRQYFYEHRWQLRGSQTEAVYFEFHQTVYGVIGWAKERKAAGEMVDELTAQAKLEELWRGKPLAAHSYSAIYLTEARVLVSRIIKLLSRAAPDFESAPRLEIQLANGRVIVKPDLLERSFDVNSVTARKLKTGRAPQDREFGEYDKLTLAALQAALWQNYPDKQTRVVVDYLSNENQLPYDTTPKKVATQTDKLAAAIAGIERGDFRPNPDSQNCPSCAHYFLCPGGA